ncbi:MAG: hypothetical protein WBY53_16175 [Acidobacteriaceae bacterium]
MRIRFGLATALAIHCGVFTAIALGQTVNAEFVNGVINASLVPGTGDIGAKINSAMGLVAGGTIMVPNGIYQFDTTIQPPANIGTGVTVDCGSPNTVLEYNGTADAIYIQDERAASIVFRNCTILASSTSGPSANGVHIQASAGVSFQNCVVENFKKYGIYNQGAIGSSFLNVNAISNGINLVNSPDISSSISTNAMRWVGGSLQYGVTTNYWESPNSGGRDQLNIIESVWELSSAVPQAIIEACDSCTIKDSYIEYIGVSGESFPTMIVGNALGSGYGSGTSQSPKHLRFENNLTFFPGSSLGYEVFNVSNLTLDDLDEQGLPKYIIDFSSTPTLGITNVNVIAGLFNWSVMAYLNSQSTYFGPFNN